MEVKTEDRVHPHFIHLTSHPFHLTSERQKWICALFAVVITLILPVFSLSHRPYHTPLNTSVEISWHCLVLDRSPSMVCCLSTRVIHCTFKWLLGGSPPLCPPLRLQAFSSPSNFQIQTCRFSLGSTQTLLQALPWCNRQELPVPTSPRCSSGWAFAAMPQGPLGSGRANCTLMTSGMWRKCSCGNTQGTSPRKPAKWDMRVPAV